MICNCCHHNTEKRKCSYCGYNNLVALTDSAEFEQKFQDKIDLYKETLINSIKNISICSYEYSWNNDKNELELVNENIIQICQGKDCYDQLFISDKIDFSNIDYQNKDVDCSRSLKVIVELILNNQTATKYEFVSHLNPREVKPPMRMCVMIKSDKLQLVLGLVSTEDASNKSFSEPHDIDFGYGTN